MSHPQQGDHGHPVPAFLGGDLPEGEQSAFQEAHDADEPSIKGIVSTADHEKTEPTSGVLEESHRKSSSASSNEPVADIEKGSPTANASGKDQSEETAVEQDPNVVDWDGPDDPAKYVHRRKLQMLRMTDIRCQ